MSFRIQSPPQPPIVTTSETTSPAARAKDDAAKVGREFEAIFVRQMLASTKVAGRGGGYADMAVEALASSITAAGGLGMGRAIEQALSAHTGAPQPAVPPLPSTAEKEASPPQAGPQSAVRGVEP